MPVSERPHPRHHAFLHLGLLAALLLAAVALVANRPGGVVAQSATPVASADCAPPSPVAAPNVPDAVDGSTPAATPEAVVGVDDATGAAIGDVIDALGACLGAGNAETVTELVTDRYLADAYGGGERMTKEDYLALAPSAPVIPFSIVSVGQIGFSGQDTATAQVITVQGNQLRTEEWTFLFRLNRQASATPTAGGEGHWLVHQVSLLPSTAPAGASEAEAVEQDGSIAITPGDIDGPDIVFTVRNADAETHEFLVLRLTDGATVDELIRPTSDGFPRNIDVIGQETIPAGETRSLVFVEMEPGDYTVVCLLPDGDGVPHLALGETTTFTVS
jgi:hypothetical protein